MGPSGGPDGHAGPNTALFLFIRNFKTGLLVDDFIVSSVPKVAMFFGISQQAVEKWRIRGMPEKQPDGWHLDEIAQWRIEYLTKKQPSPQPSENETDEPALEQLRLANAEIARFKLAELQGDLLRRESVRDFHNGFIADFHRLSDELQREGNTSAFERIEEFISDHERRLQQLASDTVNAG